MLLKEIIPNTYINLIKINKIKRRFPQSLIKTTMVGKNVDLGIKTALAEGVDIRDNVIIGNYSYVNKGTIIASGTIGRFTSIGYNCQIGMFEHPTKYISTSPHLYLKEKNFINDDAWEEITSPPVIGNDVWVGSNVLILQGVRIGDGAIIAGGSVVTKDVSPYSIVAGIPAAEIKMRFTDKEIKFLQNLKWWEMSENELNKYRYLFEAKEKWVDLI